MTRGERNCNPGNIDRVDSVIWLGQAQDQSTDDRFVVFVAPLYGIRAIGMVLLHGFVHEGHNTIALAIGAWAPPGENDTVAYTNYVALAAMVKPTDPINLKDPNLLARVVTAIIHMENGECIYSNSEISYACAMALKVFM